MPANAPDFDRFPAELQLLLLAAQPRLGPVQQARLDELTNGPRVVDVDWDVFLTLTLHHRLAPAIFASIGERLPAGTRQALQRTCTGNAFEALRAAAELGRIRDAFAAHGLPLIALKGIVLAQMLYGSPNARHVGDLDLLTTTQSLSQQLGLLNDLGYRLIHPDAPLTPRRMQAYTRFWKDFTLEGADSGFELDLHWRLFNNPTHPANRLVAAPALTSVTVFNTALDTLTLRDQFLYTAAHGVGEAFTYLKALADVAAFSASAYANSAGRRAGPRGQHWPARPGKRGCAPGQRVDAHRRRQPVAAPGKRSARSAAALAGTAFARRSESADGTQLSKPGKLAAL